jgi:hypothetical protein
MTCTPETLHQALDRLYREAADPLRGRRPPYFLRAVLDGVAYRCVFVCRTSDAFVARETETDIQWQYRVQLDANLVSEYEPAIIPTVMHDFGEANFAAIQVAHKRGEASRIIGDVYAPIV